jgi:hypothetical protein
MIQQHARRFGLRSAEEPTHRDGLVCRPQGIGRILPKTEHGEWLFLQQLCAVLSPKRKEVITQRLGSVADGCSANDETQFQPLHSTSPKDKILMQQSEDQGIPGMHVL